MIGIFGGTFDPIHYGHLKTVQHVKDLLQLEQVRLIPLGQAVHRNQPVASAEQRLQMLQTALESYPGLIADDREIQRQGGSYTFDTLRSLADELPGQRLYLITGTDAFNHFAQWYKPEAILSLANLLVMQRPDEKLSEDPALQQLVNQHSDQISFIEVPQIPISSSMIRQHLQNDQPIHAMLPEAVIQLIEQWQLYR